MRRRNLAALLAATTAWFSAPSLAQAQECPPEPPGTPENVCTLRPDGASSDDVGAYCFIPTLLRGQNPANYAFTADDTGGVCHGFQTFMRFDLPADLLAPGETVTTAFLNVPYLFSFAIEGEPAEPPHAPVSMLVHRVSTPWTEGAVSWRNRPDFELEPLDTVTDITDFGNVTFNVTEVVASWAQSPASNYGFALTSLDERVLGFYSWEAPVDITLLPSLVLVTDLGIAPEVCGDVNDDGVVNTDDLAAFRLALAFPSGAPLSTAGESKCTLIGEAGPCDALDVAVLTRALVSPPLEPGIAPVCDAVTGP